MFSGKNTNTHSLISHNHLQYIHVHLRCIFII